MSWRRIEKCVEFFVLRQLEQSADRLAAILGEGKSRFIVNYRRLALSARASRSSAILFREGNPR